MADMSPEIQRLVELEKKEWKIAGEIDNLKFGESKSAKTP